MVLSVRFFSLSFSPTAPCQADCLRPRITHRTADHRKTCSEEKAFKVFIHGDLASIVFLASRITAETSDDGSSHNSQHDFSHYSLLQQRLKAGKLKTAELPLDRAPVVCPDTGTPRRG